MAERDNRAAGEMPTMAGTATALSSASGQGRAAATRVPESAGGPGNAGDAELEPGTVLAGRYVIESVLGTGGMGSVYRAHDGELDRTVALKVIRPDLARNTVIVERFKQELRLSHQVTHRNVVRLYDLAEDAGLRFMTMEFIAGRDLRSILLERGKLPPDEAVGLLEQICEALRAAHSVGVLHRDLKPQNVMVDESGRVVVMDFGLARTFEGDGMTQSGVLVGTMEYMSPEQALGRELDQRSDIFALGLIGYELLTGDMPFKAESAIASLLRRTRERASACTVLDATIPKALSDVIAQCLEVEVNQRYRDTAEILHDLEAWRNRTAAASLRFHANVSGMSGRWLPVLGGTVLAAALGFGVAVVVRHFAGRPAAKAVQAPAISVAVMPFYNASGDGSLDWIGSSVAEMLGSDIGESAEVRMVSADRLEQVAEDLHLSATSQTDAATLRRVAEFTSAQTVIFGQYAKAGGAIRIEATMLDLAHDRRSEASAQIAEKDLLQGVDGVAAALRAKITADPRVQEELKAHAERPSTPSMAALREYEQGQKLERNGKSIEAQQAFQQATEADPNFALAYAKLADTYASLGHDDLAQTASRKAVQLSYGLPPQERYRIEADNARINNNTAKAIAAYQELAAANPSDTDVQFALAGMYEQTSDFAAARQRLAAVLTGDPKNVDALLASGRVEIRSGNPQAGLDFLTRALNLAILLGNQEEKANVLQATGIAYAMLNRPDDALGNYRQSLAIKQQIGDKRGMAASLEEIGSIEDGQGKPAAALGSYQQALALRKEIGDQEGIGNALIDTGSFYHDHGKPEQALEYYTNALDIERQLGDTSRQALCLNNIGTIKADEGDYQAALTWLDQAYELRQKLHVPEDLGESLHNLAEVNANLGQYDAALGYALKAIDAYRSANDQHGTAMESAAMAKIFAAQGRYGAALTSMKSALDTIRQTKETTSLTVEIVGGWGDLLAQAGRGPEGKASLDEALNVAHQIRDDASTALATEWLGDAAFYQGDNATARQQYARALDLAQKTGAKETVLVAKVDLARTDLAQGHAAAAAQELSRLTQQADAMGMKSVAVECAVDLEQAWMESGHEREAAQQLGITEARAENLGLRLLDARAQYLQALLLTKTGRTSEAAPEYRQVVQALEGIGKEGNSPAILERADLKRLYRGAQAGAH